MFTVENSESLNKLLRVESKTIFHYTSFGTLPVFLTQDADLYCTNAKCLNDPMEVWTGAFSFADYLFNNKLLPKVRYTLLKQNIKETIENNWFDLWVMSLSSECDDLTQWRGYTSKEMGGYAIGFNVAKIVAALSKITANEKKYGNTNKVPFLVKCWYAQQEKICLDQLYQHLYEQYKESFATYANCKQLDDDKIRSVISSIMIASMHVKHDAFRSEKEARIALTVPGCDYSTMKIVGGKPRMPVGIPTIGTPLYKYIDSIYVSPHGNRNVLLEQVKWLKKSSGADFSICESSIPYDSSR